MDRREASKLKKFCDSLPACIPLTHHMKFKMSSNKDRPISYCPLSSCLKGWRKKWYYLHDRETHLLWKENDT